MNDECSEIGYLIKKDYKKYPMALKDVPLEIGAMWCQENDKGGIISLSAIVDIKDGKAIWETSYSPFNEKENNVE